MVTPLFTCQVCMKNIQKTTKKMCKWSIRTSNAKRATKISMTPEKQFTTRANSHVISIYVGTVESATKDIHSR